MRLRCSGQSGYGGIKFVGHDAQVCDFTAQPFEQGAQKEPVGVVNSARRHVGRRHSSRHHQLVTGRKKRHPHRPADLQAVKTNAGGQAQSGRTQTLTARQHHSAAGHVFAAPAYPLTGRRYHGHAHLLCVQRFDVFLHNYCISARRYRCTRENTGGSHGLEQVARAARRNALRDLQH